MVRPRILLAMLVATALAVVAWRVQAKDWAAYYCDSRISAGTWSFPKIGPFNHASVAICPDGESPEADDDGGSVSNPHCAWYGTKPLSDRFEVEPRRFDVGCRPADAPASLVNQRIQSYRQTWTPLQHNCQKAAAEATAPDDEDDPSPNDDGDE